MKTLLFVRNAMYCLAAICGAIGVVTFLVFVAGTTGTESKNENLIAGIGFILGVFSAIGPFLAGLFFLSVAAVMQGFLVVREGLDNLLQVGFQMTPQMTPQMPQPGPRPLTPEEQAAIAHRERLAAYDAELAARRAAKQGGTLPSA